MVEAPGQRVRGAVHRNAAGPIVQTAFEVSRSIASDTGWVVVTLGKKFENLGERVLSLRRRSGLLPDHEAGIHSPVQSDVDVLPVHQDDAPGRKGGG